LSDSLRSRVTEVFKVESVVRGPGLWQ
jgi:hypothetical protein